MISVIALLVCASPALAQLTGTRNRTGVLPEPQKTYAIPAARGETFQFDQETVILVPNSEDRIGADLLARDLMDRGGLEVTIVEGQQEAEAGRAHVLITRADVPPRNPAENRLRRAIGETRAEGYRLYIDGRRIVIEGHDAAGALYGVQTLRQLMRGDLSVQPLAVLDWPEMEWRITYGNFAGRVATTPELIDQFLESASMSKLNMVIMESLWNHKGNWWFNPTGKNLELATYFFKRAKELHIEPVPLVQGPGWGYGVTDYDPMLTEGVWLEDEPVVLRVAEPTALAQTNVVTNEHAPIIVTSEDGETRYEAGTDFKVIKGYTVRPYHAAHEPWRLQALEGGKIEDGQTVLVSYNHVGPHAHKAYNLADPGSYAVIDRTIDGVMTTHKPNFVHIGHDEVWNLGTDYRDIQSGLEPGELVLKHLMHVYDRIKSHNPDAVIMVWDDLFRRTRSGTSYGILHPFADRIPKDLILCPWIYHATDEHFQQMRERLRNQTELGFEVVGTPSGYFMKNSLLWYQALRQYLPSGKARGMMFTEWEAVLNGSNMPAAAELMWSGERTIKPVFDQLDGLFQRLKASGLAMTYPLDSFRQHQGVAGLFSEAALAAQSPTAIARGFRQNVIGDTHLFEATYGKDNWEAMANGHIHIQQVAMIQRIPAYIDAVATYIEAEHRHSLGERSEARTMLHSAIDQLHAVGYLTHEKAERMRQQADGETWVDASTLLGFELAPYRPN